jgi:ATP-dependent DNA helicase RecQ
MPSRRRTGLVDAVADALGTLGKLPVHRALTTTSIAPDAFQAEQANSAHQVDNVWRRFIIDPAALPPSEVLTGPVLLVDDEVDSRWTMTVAAWQLTGAGTGRVLPFALRSR